MNLRQIRTFVTVAEAGGFAETGDALRLSQSAATRQIQGLERDYGILLFDRIGRRISLTSAGAEFLQACRAVLKEAEALSERAQALSHGNAGRLRIGASPQHIETVLASFIPSFVGRHSSVELELTEDGGSRLAERLDRGDIHLALIADDMKHAGLFLANAVLLAVMSPNHRLASDSTIDIRALSGEPIIALHGFFGSRQWFEAACRSAEFKPQIIFESSAPQTLLALAANGHGVAILPSNVALDRFAVHAAVLQVMGSPIARRNIIAWNAQRFLPVYAQRFADELVAHCREVYPGRGFLDLSATTSE